MATSVVTACLSIHSNSALTEFNKLPGFVVLCSRHPSLSLLALKTFTGRLSVVSIP